MRIGEADLADRGFVALGVPSCCAERVRTVAYWAAWADALPFTRQRRPDAATRRGRELAAAEAAAAPFLKAALDRAPRRARRPQRLHTMSRQKPGIGIVAGRDRQLVCLTRPISRAPPLWPPRRCPRAAALTVRCPRWRMAPCTLVLAARSRCPNAFRSSPALAPPSKCVFRYVSFQVTLSDSARQCGKANLGHRSACLRCSGVDRQLE